MIRRYVHVANMMFVCSGMRVALVQYFGEAATVVLLFQQHTAAAWLQDSTEPRCWSDHVKALTHTSFKCLKYGQPRQSSRHFHPGQAGSQITWATLANIRPLALLDLHMVANSTMISTEAEPHCHFSTNVFRCHRQSPIVDKTDEPFRLSKKLISKHVR